MTWFVVGRDDRGTILQAVIGLRSDLRNGDLSSSGATVTDPDGREAAAFGREAWDRRKQSGTAPGRIYHAQLRGSRIGLSGALAPMGADGRPAGDGALVPFSIDARCDDPDQG